MATFDELCRWYKERRAELYLLYPDKIALIYNYGVRGIYETYDEAYAAGESTVGLGRFIIKKITKEDEVINVFTNTEKS